MRLIGSLGWLNRYTGFIWIMESIMIFHCTWRVGDILLHYIAVDKLLEMFFELSQWKIRNENTFQLGFKIIIILNLKLESST